MKIIFLHRDEIDVAKWDSCIARSVNGMVYGYSWYLDIVCESWSALVDEEYQTVFPLPHKTKYGINYIYQPFFTQQLGLFSTNIICNEVFHSFVKAIPKSFKYIAINLNTYIKTNNLPAQFTPRVTYHLDLIESYPAISSRYSTNTKRNISRAVTNNISVIKGVPPAQLIELKKQNNRINLEKQHFSTLNKLISQTIGNGVGETYGAYNARNELCAGALFIKTNGKAIYLLASSTPDGKENRAMFKLIDFYISQNSESNLVLDFEGSNIESVARFYASFGASPCTYSHMKINRLPWLLKIFK